MFLVCLQEGQPEKSLIPLCDEEPARGSSLLQYWMNSCHLALRFLTLISTLELLADFIFIFKGKALSFPSVTPHLLDICLFLFLNVFVFTQSQQTA